MIFCFTFTSCSLFSIFVGSKFSFLNLTWPLPMTLYNFLFQILLMFARRTLSLLFIFLVSETSEQSWNQECNKTISLTREHPKTTVVSSGFPHQYPDNIHCETIVTAPPGFQLIIDFEELVLENEPT